MTEFTRTIERQYFAHAVGRQLTCPLTGAILDARHAVEITVRDGSERILAVMVVTASAWDDHAAAMYERASAARYTLEIVDGRELFGSDHA